MGLFSKTKTYVESTSVGLFTEATKTVKQVAISSVIQDRSISDDLLGAALNGLGRRSKQFYRYGRDHYTYGLPEGTVEVKSASGGAVEIVLQNVVDVSADVKFKVFDYADPTLFARDYLENTRGWDADTNVVSIPPFSTPKQVTLYSAEWKSNTQIKLFYFYDTVENIEEEIITVKPVNIEDKYYHVGYTTESSPNIVLYWFYRAKDELYETLNVDEAVTESKYFPVIPIRRDNVDLTSDSQKDTELYITSKRLLNKIRLSYKDIGRGVHESPDIDAVDHAYINMSIPLQTSRDSGKMYLYEHFLDLFNKQRYKKEHFDYWKTKGNLGEEPPINKIVIKEVEQGYPTVGSYHTEMGFLYIDRTSYPGNIGKKKTVTIDNEFIPVIVGKFMAVNQSHYIIKKQVTDTQVVEIRVVGLKHINYIYGSKSIDTSLEDSLTPDSDDFNVMVNIDILDKFNIHDQTDIMNDAARICFNSVERVKLKWYQTSIFKVIVIVVAAIITVLTYGADGGSIYAAAAAAVGATTFLAQLMVAIIINYLTSVLLSKIADVIGLKNAAILAFIYTIYSIYSGGGPVMTGDNLVAFVNGLNMASSLYLKGEYTELMNDYDQMKAEQVEEQTELDRLIEAYPQTFLDPFSFLDIGSSLESGLGESPSDYYENRIHSGNIGPVVFDEARKYVDVTLALPGVGDRIGLNIL